MKKKVTCHDRYQHYEYYLTEPVGKNFDPEFIPELMPQEMLSLGVFGGLYFGEVPSEFPRAWFKNAKLSFDQKPHKELNYFRVMASQSRTEWEKKKWIHADDPRGWFQWYCRYYMGRRHEDDERQIKRWRAYRRHGVQVRKNCEAGDHLCRPKQRQSLLHWAYDARKL